MQQQGVPQVLGKAGTDENYIVGKIALGLKQ